MKTEERKKQAKNTSIQSKQLEARGVSMDMETSWAAQQLASGYTNLNDMARFQQKQLQEKEQKLLQLYDQQQQRAYQVVQRGSAGSNSSNHATSISQHTVTKTSSNSHTTSTSHGGKVRQMFDERRQTTVKGIDRSYPLEPLENKPRKQTNGNSGQKNGILTMNRQSVTVKRVVRADMNSNSNGGKPVATYHEVITRESYGPSTGEHQEADEFGNENHVAEYANGNHRNETHIEEVLDDDTIERNRMMAKLHLMEYDETLKHRVKNDLESEEFPEDFMVDVPDKLPKQSVTKKLSQAEVRLERFKHANAKRSSSITRNQTSVPKKRSDPIYPAKSTSSKDRMVKTRTKGVASGRSSNETESPGNSESKAKILVSENIEEIVSSDSDEKSVRRRDDSPRSFCTESKKSVATRAIDSKTSTKVSSDSRTDKARRSISPKLFPKESQDPADTRDTMESFKSLRSVKNRSESPKFIGKESKSAKMSEAPKLLGKETEELDNTFTIVPSETKKSPSRVTKNVSRSPEFYCKESERSATTYAIDPRTVQKFAPGIAKERPKRSQSPQFFCKESDKSATTYAIDSNAAQKLSTEPHRDGKPRREEPKFFCKETEKSATTYAINSKRVSTSADSAKNTKRVVNAVPKRNAGNEIVVSDSDTMETIIDTDTVDRHVKSNAEASSRSHSPGSLKGYQKSSNEQTAKPVTKRLSDVFERLARKRSPSPQFFGRESKKSASTMLSIDRKDSKFVSGSMVPRNASVKKRAASPSVSSVMIKPSSPNVGQKAFRKSNTSPQLYSSDSERSASVLMVRPETISKPRLESPISRADKHDPMHRGCKMINTVAQSEPRKGSIDEGRDENTRQFIRTSVSRFFSEQCGQASRNRDDDARNEVRSTETSKKLHLSRGSSLLSQRDTKTPTRPEFSPEDGGKFAETSIGEKSSSRDCTAWSRRIVDSREGTPELFSRESEKSLSPVRLGKDLAHPGSMSAERAGQIILREPVAMESMKTKKYQTKNRSSKSPENVSTTKTNETPDRRGSGNVLRSIKLIRDAIKLQDVRNQVDHVAAKHGKGFRSSSTVHGVVHGISNGWKQRSREEDRVDELVEANRKVDKRAETPAARDSAGYNSKSSTPSEVDMEIQEITMPDQYVKRERLRGTYTRAGNRASTDNKITSTYSVRKPAKKRGSLLDANVFQSAQRTLAVQAVANDLNDEALVGSRDARKNPPSGPSPTSESVARGLKHQTKRNVSREKSENDILKSEKQATSTAQMKTLNSSDTFVRKSTKAKAADSLKSIAGPLPTNESTNRESKRAGSSVIDGKSDRMVSRSRAQTPSPFPRKRGTIVANEPRKRRTPSPEGSIQAETLRSMILVRRAMKDTHSEGEKQGRETFSETSAAEFKEDRIKISRDTCSASTTNQAAISESVIVSIKEGSGSDRNYERTDSVESALRRFDSIGAESVQSTSERRKESMAGKRQTEANKSAGTGADSKTISLKALDRANVNLRGSTEGKPLRTPTGKTSSPAENVETGCKKRGNKMQETRTRKRFAKAGDSTGIAGIDVRSTSPTCKRKLFRDADSGEETETGSLRSRCSSGSTRTVEPVLLELNKNETLDSAGTVSTSFEFTAGGGTSMKQIGREEMDGTPTGVDRCLSVKRLRSIEDIRKSIEGESSNSKAGEASGKSAIANSRAERSGHRRINTDDRAGNRKEISLPRRPENVAAGNVATGDADRSSVKCTMRFFRVVKSPSPEMTKVTETSSRPRRSVPASPSKNPSTVTRRPSTELKAQETKSTKRATPMKGAEPIGSRKTTTTSTATRKSTDVVDGAILENGLHLRDHTAETKYDNDSPATKRSDAFVIDFEEQPSKENDGPVPQKPLLRKQSTEKQISSTQPTRPPSVNSTYSGSSMQGQTSTPKGKMASRVKTPISNRSSSNKSGGGTCAADQLVSCKICGRRFAHDRITLHEQICVKTGQKKRKQFDTMMFRVKGTDLEPFVKKAMASKKMPEKLKKPEVKSNWRRKHEDFINAIRSAKQVQAHLAAGGKLSDLPPPPASDTSDYVQCPHCGRKFNQTAAERHIPKCEHMLHNKPVHMRVPKPRR